MLLASDNSSDTVVDSERPAEPHTSILNFFQITKTMRRNKFGVNLITFLWLVAKQHN